MNRTPMTPAEQDALARDDLQWIMDSAEDGFYLLIAPPETQRVEAGRYAESAAVYDYARRPEEYKNKPYSFGELARWAEGQACNKLFVLNMQVVLQTDADLANLNLSRDMLARMGKVWVFGVMAYMADKLVRTARDFYAYVRLKAEFCEVAPVELQVTFPEDRFFASVEEAERAIASYAELEAKLLAEDNEDLEDGRRLSIAATLENIANVYDDYGRYDHTLSLYEHVKAVREKMLGKEHPDTANTYHNIANIYFEQGKHDEALGWYRKALDIYEKVLGMEHPDTADTYTSIASAYSAQQKYNEALIWYRKALDIFEKVLGTEHPYTANTYNNIAIVYRSQGKYDEALARYRKALYIYEKALGAEHPDTANTYNNIGVVYVSLEKYDEALAWYRKALDIKEKVLGAKHPSTLDTYRNLAHTYTAMGDETRAAEYRAKAEQNSPSQEPPT